jgi:hypothetical protein
VRGAHRDDDHPEVYVVRGHTCLGQALAEDPDESAVLTQYVGLNRLLCGRFRDPVKYVDPCVVGVGQEHWHDDRRTSPVRGQCIV